MTFCCNRCGYESKHKHHVQNHLNRKKLCAPLLEDVEPCMTLRKFSVGDTKVLENECKNASHMCTNESKSVKNASKSIKNTSKCIENESSFIENESSNICSIIPSQTQCLTCNKILSSKDALKKHTQTCKGPRLHKCFKCNKIFSTNGNLHKHMRRCKVRFETQLPELHMACLLYTSPSPRD